jgi:hypothetical protein
MACTASESDAYAVRIWADDGTLGPLQNEMWRMHCTVQYFALIICICATLPDAAALIATLAVNANGRSSCGLCVARKRRCMVSGLQILLSADGETFDGPAVATGTFEDIAAQQTATFDAAPAKAVRLRMLTPAKAGQPWASIGDLQLVGVAGGGGTPPPAPGPTPPPPPPPGPPLPSGAADLPRAGWTGAADSSQSGELL